MPNREEELLARIRERSARVAVIGLGYVGLPLAVEKAKAGFTVVGIDRNANRVAQINRGENYIGDVIAEDLAEAVHHGCIRATQDFAEVANADIITICVPTPLDRNKQPDTSFIEHVVGCSLPHIRPGQLIVLESTTYPGTTQEVIQPYLEERGFSIGRDVFLAFSPERVDPGNAKYKTKNTPKVVGGVTPACTRVAASLYEQVLEGAVCCVSSPRIAEMTKLLENIFRIVNISLMNELALLCERMGIDIWEVIEAAKTKPFGFLAFYPGPGLGGHCIPLDPFYLSWKAKEHDFTTRFIDLAGQINDRMPYHVVHRVMEILNSSGKPMAKSKVLVLGMAYKSNIDDIRESPAVKIAGLLLQRGASLTYHDPYVPVVSVAGQMIESTPLSPEVLEASDLVLITTDHIAVDYQLVIRHAPVVFDTRNATAGLVGKNIIRLGVG